MTCRFLSLIALTAALGTASCSPTARRVPTFPVTGTLTQNGKPLANAAVVFHPVAADGADVLRPRGTTDVTGAFTLTTYDGGDGAPAGDYRLTVELWTTPTADGGPVNRLPAKLAKPTTSGLTATVAAEPTALTPINLKR
jgi:hypothetical protein